MGNLTDTRHVIKEVPTELVRQVGEASLDKVHKDMTEMTEMTEKYNSEGRQLYKKV